MTGILAEGVAVASDSKAQPAETVQSQCTICLTSLMFAWSFLEWTEGLRKLKRLVLCTRTRRCKEKRICFRIEWLMEHGDLIFFLRWGVKSSL